jgi:hypothetical protein
MMDGYMSTDDSLCSSFSVAHSGVDTVTSLSHCHSKFYFASIQATIEPTLS